MKSELISDITVSIIIPVYNIGEKLLKRCVTSVINQTYSNLQIILVDDGSTNNSGETADKLATANNGALPDGRIRTISVIHKSNGGSSSARNAGLRQATGQYIGFVDSDDYVDEDYVSLMMDAIDRYGIKMAQISRDEIAEDGSRLPDVCIPPKSERIITGEEQLRELLLHKGDCSFCTRLTNRELFKGREFPEGKLNEDFYLLISMLPDIDKYVILPKQAYHVYYRLGSNSRSEDKDIFRPVFKDIVDNADYVEKLAQDKYPKLKNEAKRFALFQRLDYLLHVPVSMMNKDNDFYVSVIKYLRRNIGHTISNKYLTGKNKIYLVLLTAAPVLVRKIHRRIRLG
ncbi:MAG: glycosyltransferase [Lachnospiraceae bacterium]|nr:glycosyltransferase [Lachnospiraceae bacterium]